MRSFNQRRPGLPQDPRAVDTRADQLIQAWGKQAVGTAQRYAEQMARTGSPTAAFHMEVADRVKAKLEDDLQRRIRDRQTMRGG